MTPEMWAVVGVFLALGVGMLIASTRPEYPARAARSLSRSIGLAIPVELESSIRTRVLGRRRSGVIGAMIGGLAAALVLQLWTVSSTFSSVLVLAATFIGVAAGVVVSALRYSNRLADEQPRFARAVAVTTNDFIAPLERGGTRAAVLLAVVLLSILIALGNSEWSRSGLPSALLLSGVLVVAAIVFLLLFEALGKRIVVRGSPSASATELAWDDALRSTALRDLASAPAILGLFATVTALLELPPTLGMGREPHNILVNASMIVLIYGTAALTAVYFIAKPQRHFLRRLWPDLAAATTKAPSTTDTAS